MLRYKLSHLTTILISIGAAGLAQAQVPEEQKPEEQKPEEQNTPAAESLDEPGGFANNIALELPGVPNAKVADKVNVVAPPKFRVGLFLGYNYLSDENELGQSYYDTQVPQSGFLMGARGSYLLLDSLLPSSTVNPQLRLELEAKLTNSSTEGSDSRESIRTPVLGWRAHAVVDFLPAQKLRPFVLAGIGGETVFGENKYMTSPDSDFATYAGFGARYVVADALAVRADLRFGSTASREDALSALFEAQLGLSYEFGAAEQSLVPVASPTPAEVVEPAPLDLDTDGDGILDKDDNCPKLPEIMNGIDDSDGCPEVDSDYDGLLGSKDQCPSAAEDIDGFEDEDGCPDLDNDKDGRPDVVDKCPLQAENLNGYEDADGCPDEIPAKVKQFTGTIKGIKFKSSSARILHKTRRTLKAAHKVLAANPSVRIEISGHTDSRGDDRENQALSRKRADFVKWYLVDKGIAADRIETIGYGPNKPIATNDTRAGRKINRRIEFRLLPGQEKIVPKEQESVPVETAPKEVVPSVPASDAATEIPKVPVKK